MNDIYVARQPIFGRNMKLFGYELLYRKSTNNFYEGSDDETSTAAVIDNSFIIGFDELVDGKRGFINFSEKMLLDEIPSMLPKQKVVIEILERVHFSDTVLEVCEKYKKAGYMLALDDFSLHKENRENKKLLDLIDIVKIENFERLSNDEIDFIRKYKNRIKFLAERVETREQHKEVLKIGFNLFQGFFFSKPVMYNAKEISSLDINLLLILNELNKPEPEYKTVTSIVERDLGLSYKLLRIVNSVFYSTRYRVKSIQQALVHLGTEELKRWIYVLLIKGVQSQDNAELVKTSIIRGKMLALIASKVKKEYESDFFITGIFSSIDVILSSDMQKVLSGLPLTFDVQNALLGKHNFIRKCLDAVLDFEKARWDSVDSLMEELGLEKDTFAQVFLEAIKWQRTYAL